MRIEELRGEAYLARADCECAGTQRSSRSACTGRAFQSERDEWILAMAAAGLGVGLIPAHSAAYPGVVALRIEPDIAREIALVTVRGRPDQPTLGALLDEVMRGAHADPSRQSPVEAPSFMAALAR